LLSAGPPRPATRRQELLDAAANLFADRGFAGVTMDDIGAARGISGPALYHHFSSKEAMLGEMLVAISDHLLARGREIVARHDDPARAVDELVDFHVDFSVSHPELITVHLRDLVYAPEDDQAQVRRLQRQYVEVWVGALCDVAPGLEAARARTVIHATFGLLNSTPFQPAASNGRTAAVLRTLGHHLLDPAVLAEL
jgi:AcrR family transcriptional regulator